jgi:ATP-dependent DNA helicase PIF1
MPAWAITFHKSQGMSLDLVEVDLGPSVWEKGQAYVALSRARTLAGLTILALSTATIWADPHVIRWHAEQFGAELGSELEPSVEDIEVGGDSD